MNRENSFRNERSQLYAKILAGVNSVIALPALGGAAASVILFLMSLESFNEGVYPIGFCFCVWLLTIIGLLLLFGYWRHAFDKLSPAKSILLWKSTIVYNALLLAAVSITFSLALADASRDSAFFVYLIVNFLYCAAAIVLSIFALPNENRS